MSAQTYEIDLTLCDVAAWKVQHDQEKLAFVPAGGDPAAGGAPPADPAAAAGGGAPPPDPAAGGAPAGPPPELMAAMQPMIQQAVQQAMMAGGGGGAGGAGGPATGPAGVGQKMKIDPTMVYLKLGRLEKLMLHMYEQLGWPIPPDAMNDDQMIQAAAGQAPSMPGAPPAPGGAAPAPGGADPAAGGAPPEGAGLPAMGNSPAVPGLPMGGGQPKQAESLHDLLQQGTLLANAIAVSRMVA